jgi:hypothetical protein
MAKKKLGETGYFNVAGRLRAGLSQKKITVHEGEAIIDIAPFKAWNIKLSDGR